MTDFLDAFLKRWERAYQADQALAAQGVPPEAEARWKLAAEMEACDAELAQLLEAHTDPSRGKLDFSIPPPAQARPQALWPRIN